MVRTLALVRASIFVAAAVLAAVTLLALAGPADARDAGGVTGQVSIDGEFDSAEGAEDPTFAYETVVPGYYLSRGTGVSVDADGNAYVIGSAYADRVRLDVLVTKVGPDGTVLWTTYIEGSGHDYAEGIVLDGEGDVLITGWTDSGDFPITPDALDGTLTGFRDAFLTKLSSVDGAILYSTFLGGDYVDEAHGITLNEAGEIYLVGSTESTDFPTVNAYQDEPSAPLYIFSDAFITKLTAAGDSILYSTYFGGFENDVAESVALDAEGNIVIAGETDAQDFPLANPIQSEPDDIFVSRLSADGSALQFSTYFGGEDFDRLGEAALDSEGFVYLTGSTRSINFPTTPGAYQEDFVGEILGCEVPFGADFNCDDAFVTKLGTDGSGLVYSTYLGGIEIEEARDIAVDSQGRAHVVGFTYSPDFPPDGIDFGAEIFVSRFDPSGGGLEYSVTRDSGSANAGHGVAVDDEGDVYFTGAVNVPADVYIAKITEIDIPDVTVSLSSSVTEVPRKSFFLFDVQITNNEATSQTFKVWTGAQTEPAGAIHQPLEGPVNVTLDPGETKTFSDVRHWVGRVPLGAYRYYARIGMDFPGPLWDQSYLEIEVTR